MSRELLLALDLGTTSVRALIVTRLGEVRARAQRPLSVSYPAPGRVEQDPVEMWNKSLEVMREAIAGAGVDASAIASIGVVTQRATTLAWEAGSLQPLACAIGWQDHRTAERVAGFRAAGLPINTLASATKFEWWMQNDPAIQKAASDGTLRFGTPDTWLSANLTGGGVSARVCSQAAPD